MTPIDYALILLLAAAVVFAVRHVLKKRGSCCGDCTACGGNCAHANKKNET